MLLFHTTRRFNIYTEQRKSILLVLSISTSLTWLRNQKQGTGEINLFVFITFVDKQEQSHPAKLHINQKLISYLSLN